MTIDSVKKMKDALCEKLKVSFGVPEMLPQVAMR